MVRWLVTMLTVVSATAAAQTRGTVRIAGHVSQMASVRFFSDSTVGSGVQGTNAGGADGSLDYTLDLGDVGIVPGRDNGVRGGEVRLILRSNASYVLTASVAGSGFANAAGDLTLR